METVIQFPDNPARVVPKEVAVPVAFEEILTLLGLSPAANTLPHEFGSSRETIPELVKSFVTEVLGFGS
jgi:hypothetical protein